MRRLMLHMGLAKTGSTALQHWCVWNRDFLFDHGVRYPEHTSDADALAGGTTSPGNGTVLLPFLGAPPRMNQEAADRGIDHVIAELVAGEAPVTLVSNEKMWGQFGPKKIKVVADRIRAEGVTPQAVVYLRDIAGHAVSAYAQRVQQGAVVVDLDEYLLNGDTVGKAYYDPRLRQRLERLVDTFGPENVIVRHYDSVRQRLIDDFLSEVLAIENRDGVRSPPRPIANRSLGRRELEWKRYLNARLVHERPRSKTLGRWLAMRPGLPDDDPLRITDIGLAHLEESHGADVAWVNERFFDGEPVLSVAGSMKPASDDQQTAPLAEVERYLLDWIAGPGETAD